MTNDATYKLEVEGTCSVTVAYWVVAALLALLYL
jgi:hypothetical protein